MGEVSEIENCTSRSSIFKYFRAIAGVGPYSKALFRYPFAHSYSRTSTEVLFLVTFRDSPSTRLASYPYPYPVPGTRLVSRARRSRRGGNV